MFSLGWLGRLLIICGGLAMTLHGLKEMKFIEIALWFVAIFLLVSFWQKFFSLIIEKLDLIFKLLVNIDEKLKI